MNNRPISFYRELKQIAREGWKADRKRAIKEGVSLLLLFGLFMAGLWLAGAMGWGW